MKKRYRQWATQFYDALRRRGQTWTRSDNALDDWAYEFEELEDKVGGRRQIQRVLDWYCDCGCGALFVPLIGTAESFRNKFRQIEEAMERLKGQPLIYFDDLLEYHISPTRGSAVQQERMAVMQKVNQQIQFVDDLIHGREKLPSAKARLKSKTNANELSAAEKQQLNSLCIVHEDILWNLLMDNPIHGPEFAKFLERKGVWRKLRRFGCETGRRKKGASR